MPETPRTKQHGKNNVFQFREKRKTHKKERQRLEDFPIIKPGVDEKILCVQRRHPIAIITSLSLQVLFALFLIFSVIFISIFLPQISPITSNNWILMTYIALIIISIFLLIAIYTFMSWYYQFYIITNKSILHRYVFRIAGPFSDIVYAERMTVSDIVRHPSNLLYDFLKIQDVYVHFSKLEREDPFIFKTPDNAQQIEDLIHDLVISPRSQELTQRGI